MFRKSTLVELVALCWMILTVGLAEDPRFQYELNKSGDTAVVSQSENRILFAITSESGIGGISITPKMGEWPEQTLFRLQYKKGIGFRYLESLVIRTDRILIDGNLACSEKMPFRFLSGARDPAPNGVEVPAGTISVKVEKGPEFIEISLPRNLLRDSDKVSIKWIDAYRG